MRWPPTRILWNTRRGTNIQIYIYGRQHRIVEPSICGRGDAVAAYSHTMEYALCLLLLYSCSHIKVFVLSPVSPKLNLNYTCTVPKLNLSSCLLSPVTCLVARDIFSKALFAVPVWKQIRGGNVLRQLRRACRLPGS